MKLLLLMAMLVCCSCSAAGTSDGGAVAGDPIALPSVATLDRIASAAPPSEVVAFSGRYDGDVLHRDGAPMAWIIRRIGPLDPGGAYTECYDGGMPFDYTVPSGIWAAVADFATGTWVWRDVSNDPVIVQPLGTELLGTTTTDALSPLSAEGYVYLAVVTVGDPVLASPGLALNEEQGGP